MTTGDEDANDLVDGLFREVDDQFKDLEREYLQAREGLDVSDMDRRTDPLEAANERFALMSEVASLRSEIARQSDQLDERDRLLAELGDRISEFEAAEATRNQLITDLKAAEQKAVEEKREQARLQALLDARAAERQELGDVAHRLQNERDHVQDLLTTSLARFDEVEATRVELDAKLHHLEAAQQAATREHENRSKELTEARAKIGELTDQVTDLTRLSKTATERADKAEHLAERRTNEAGYLNRRMEAMNEKVEKSDGLDAQVSALRRELANVERANTQLERDLTSQRAEAAASAAAVESIAARASDYDELVARIAVLEKERDDAWKASLRGDDSASDSTTEAETQSLAERAKELGARRTTTTAEAAPVPADAPIQPPPVTAAPVAAAIETAPVAEVLPEPPLPPPPSPPGTAPDPAPPLADATLPEAPDAALAEAPDAALAEAPDATLVEVPLPEPPLPAPPAPHADWPEVAAPVVEPMVTDPASADPALIDPASADPALIDPASADPALIDPALIDPASADPALIDPALAAPAQAAEALPDPPPPPRPPLTTITFNPDPDPEVAALQDLPAPPSDLDVEPAREDLLEPEPPSDLGAPEIEDLPEPPTEPQASAFVAATEGIDPKTGLPIVDLSEPQDLSDGATIDAIAQAAASAEDNATRDQGLSAQPPTPTIIAATAIVPEPPAPPAMPEPTTARDVPAFHFDEDAGDAPQFDLLSPATAVGGGGATASTRKRTVLPADLAPNTPQAVAHLLGQRGVVAIVDARSSCGRTGIRPSELFQHVESLRDHFDLPIEVVVTPVSTPIGGAPNLAAIGVHHVTGADTVADRVRALCMGFPADQPLVVIAGDDHVRRAAIGEEANVVDPSAVLNIVR